MEALLRRPRTEEFIEYFYRDFEERNGIRPRAVEAYHAGFNPRSNTERSWLAFVERMGGLNSAEQAVWSADRDFFSSLEITEASRSYKLVLLVAMLEGESLIPSLTIDEITGALPRLQSGCIAWLRTSLSIYQIWNPLKGF